MVRSSSRLLLLSLAVLPMLARAAPGQWKLAGEAPISHKASVAAFVDEQNGITGGYAGAMYLTRDGGKTWTPGVNSSACRFGLELLPGGMAWSAGNQGNVRASRDGGAHWQVAASFGRSEPRHARHLSFVDAQRGLIAAPEELGLTADGGESWKSVAVPPRGGMIAAAALSEEGGGLRIRVLDENGDLWLSADGGASWSQATSPVRTAVFESIAGPYAALRFAGAEGALAAVQDEGNGVVRAHLYRTHDGGKTWGEDAVPGGLKGSVLTLSSDAKLLTTFDSTTLRLYRLN
jgi:photosystem II stability/assembly factor-like uncharacterized protein